MRKDLKRKTELGTDRRIEGERKRGKENTEKEKEAEKERE